MLPKSIFKAWINSKHMRKPWNRVDLPVYSVSCRDESRHNMHICTYVSAVSMHPKRYMVALYHGTLTLELVDRTGSFLLQLLASDQYNLVRLLGQQSGHDRDKIQALRKRDLIVPYKDQFYLKDALAILECQVLDTLEGGDHKIFLCGISAHRNLREGDPLTISILRNKGIIRA